MIDHDTASFAWVCLVQALFVAIAAATVVGLMLAERSTGYEPRHRAAPGVLSTWQSHGREFLANLTATDPPDLAQRRDAVEATARSIEERVELWNRDLLSGPLFEYDPAPGRYEPSAGDLAYLELSPGALERSASEPARVHPARVDTSELTIVEVAELAGVT